MTTQIHHWPGFSALSEPGLSLRVSGFFHGWFAMAKVDPYISFRKSLIRDGRVRILSEKLRTTQREVVGALVHLWSIGDDYADKKGVLFGWKPEDVDDEIGLEGFVAALPPDWFSTNGEWAQLPRYQQHNGTTAKTRIKESRQRRASRAAENPVRKNADKNRTRREEKRRDPPPMSPRGDSAGAGDLDSGQKTGGGISAGLDLDGVKPCS